MKQKIPNTYILRPSLILGERDKRRIGESIGAVLLKFTALFLVGRLKDYRAIAADCIASAMISLAKSKPDMQIVNSDIIQEFGS